MGIQSHQQQRDQTFEVADRDCDADPVDNAEDHGMIQFYIKRFEC